MYRVAVIGAGWAGLQISKVLLDSGYDVTIFETLSETGGTWNPAIAYYNLSIHSAIFKSQFYNFNDFNHHNKLKRYSAKDMFDYIQSYSINFGLHKHIKFNHKVVQIEYNSKSQKSIITIEDINKGEKFSDEFDFAISTQFNAPRMPKLRGEEKFTGKIYHSNDIKEKVFNHIIKNKLNTVIIGGSKSATDLAYSFSKRNFQITLVMRQMYWFLNYNKVVFNHKRSKRPNIVNRLIFFLGLLFSLGKTSVIIVSIIWWLTGILRCPGKMHFNFKKFHLGYIDEDQLDTIEFDIDKEYSEIEALEGKTIKLENGKVLDCDVLICATGCDPFNEKILLYRDGVAIDYDAENKLYKSFVIPKMPKLVFTGLTLAIIGPIGSYHKAAWILKYIEDNLTTEEIEKRLNNTINDTEQPNFKNGSVLFNSASIGSIQVKNHFQSIADEFNTRKLDMVKFIYNYTIKLEIHPVASFEKFIISRQVKS